MARLLLSLVAISTVWLAAAMGTTLEKRGACPVHYMSGPNNLCFRFGEDRRNFQQAKLQCEAEGGMLANTQSDAAYNFVRQHIERNPTKANVVFGWFGEVSILTPWANGWFVGATRKGSFQWFNGQLVQGHWCKQMPDNFFGGENCLQQMAGNNGWNDIPCKNKLRYICQKAMDLCAGFKCGNGRCIASGGRASCSCSKGWTGNRCENRVDPCAGVKCGNGRCAADKMLGGSARCVCSKGWTGNRCENHVDPCAGINCGNGRCAADKMLGGSARCVCSDGWTGKICNERVSPCAANPCQNGGHCSTNSPTHYSCKCVGNFKGQNCEKSCRFEVTKAGLPVKLDAIILFDGSNSLMNSGGDQSHPTDFLNTLMFIEEIAEKLDFSAGKSRLELVQYSHKVRVELDFASTVNMNIEALKDKISTIEYLRGGTFTDKGLEQAFNIFQTSGRKAKDVAKYLFTITDGDSQRAAKIKVIIPKLKSLGVELVAVGVGPNINTDELTLLAGGNIARVFSVDSFEQLNGSLMAKMVEDICE